MTKIANAKKSILKIDQQDLTISNPHKLFWPKQKITKLELAEYYLKICPFILPFIMNRPQSLHRFPDGYIGKNFYQKNVSKLNLPKWIKTKKIKSILSKKVTEYLICDSCNSLIFMVNLGCIEIHPWNSRIENLNYPEWIIFDLDPNEINFTNVMEVALSLHQILKMDGIDSYCKTSGASGLHIYIPNKKKNNYSETKDLAFKYAYKLKNKFPNLTSTDRNPVYRRKKIYIDCLQNNWGQTIVAPYSVRPLKGAPVSTPLLWNELNENLNKESLNIKTVPERIKRLGEVWKEIF